MDGAAVFIRFKQHEEHRTGAQRTCVDCSPRAQGSYRFQASLMCLSGFAF
jgi:hypothetical protein